MSAGPQQRIPTRLRKVKRRLARLRAQQSNDLTAGWRKLHDRLQACISSADPGQFSQSVQTIQELALKAIEFEKCLVDERESHGARVAKIAAMESQLQETTLQLQSKQAELEASEACCQELTRSLDETQQKCAALHSAIQNAEIENMASSNALADAMTECSSVSKALEESEHEIEVIANALTALRAEKQALQDSLALLELEKEAAVKALDEQKSYKGQSTKALAEAKHENAGIAKALSLSQKKLEETLAELNQLYLDSETSQASLRTDLESLRLQLEEAEAARQTAEAFQRDHDKQESRLVERESQFRDEIASLEEQVAFYSNELEILKKSKLATSDDRESKALVEELRSQLLESRRETIELRMQANDLASQLAASSKPPSPVAVESMTWEERKKLLLKELESAADDDVGDPMPHRLEMEELVEITQREIDRRDHELNELRRIVEQQSNAKEGMAVGAAAIAQLLDSDELVRQEREKLIALQGEWESKARQVEIELSRERAKLARERLELDARLRSMPQHPSDGSEGEKKNQRGNWLARLGLNDNQ